MAANTAVITIADTSTITVDATVDERNVSYIQPGMTVDIDQWGTPFTGIVESVSLNSKAENGVASYPMVVTVDNPDGSLMTGSYVTYSLVASENDNCLVVPIQCVKTVPCLTARPAVCCLSRRTPSGQCGGPEGSVEGVPDGFWAVPGGDRNLRYIQCGNQIRRGGRSEGLYAGADGKLLDVICW